MAATALIGVTLFGVLFGHNLTTSLIQGFIVGL
jgi:hypothetical protein